MTTGASLITPPNTHTPPSALDDPRVQKAATQRRNRRKVGTLWPLQLPNICCAQADLSQEASPRSDNDDPFLSSTAAGAGQDRQLLAAVEQNFPASSG